MLREIEDIDGPLRADVCIVGSGAAGLTIARELEGSGLRTVVLEGGRATVDERSQGPYRSRVAGLAHGGIHDLRLRAFGGTTTRWAGQALPLFPLDFARRAWVRDSGWPLDFDEVWPYYSRAADVMGIRPFTRDPVAGWPDVLARPPAFDRERVVPFFSQFSARPNFADTIGRRLAGSASVDVVLGANVTELVPDPGATEIHAARARSLDGRALDVEADQFVVCCGGIDSARLLLASERYSDGGLGNGHDLVGRYFQDHPGFPAGPVELPAGRAAIREVRDAAA